MHLEAHNKSAYWTIWAARRNFVVLARHLERWWWVLVAINLHMNCEGLTDNDTEMINLWTYSGMQFYLFFVFVEKQWEWMNTEAVRHLSFKCQFFISGMILRVGHSLHTSKITIYCLNHNFQSFCFFALFVDCEYAELARINKFKTRSLEYTTWLVYGIPIRIAADAAAVAVAFVIYTFQPYFPTICVQPFLARHGHTSHSHSRRPLPSVREICGGDAFIFCFFLYT